MISITYIKEGDEGCRVVMEGCVMGITVTSKEVPLKGAHLHSSGKSSLSCFDYNLFKFYIKLPVFLLPVFLFLLFMPPKSFESFVELTL